MKIFFIGDIFGEGGRETVKAVLPGLKEKYSPDLVISNAENLTHGSGFSYDSIQEMIDAGIDFFTSGNHAWSNADGLKHLDDKSFPVLRPANFSPFPLPGRGYEIVKCKNGEKVLIINLIGRIFMKKNFECPFLVTDRILDEVAGEDLSAVFVDFHAEATSEKEALGYYLEGRVSALIGTHTHVATADARILDEGTAYMSDVGMTGPINSVIGVKKDIIISSFLTQLHAKHKPETSGPMIFSGVVIEVDSSTKKALNIEHVYVRK